MCHSFQSFSMMRTGQNCWDGTCSQDCFFLALATLPSFCLLWWCLARLIGSAWVVLVLIIGLRQLILQSARALRYQTGLPTIIVLFEQRSPTYWSLTPLWNFPGLATMSFVTCVTGADQVSVDGQEEAEEQGTSFFRVSRVVCFCVCVTFLIHSISLSCFR